MFLEDKLKNKKYYKNVLIIFLKYVDESYSIYFDNESLVYRLDKVMQSLDDYQDILVKRNIINTFMWQCINIGEEVHIKELLTNANIKPTRRIVSIMKGLFSFLGAEYTVQEIKELYSYSNSLSNVNCRKVGEVAKLLYSLEKEKGIAERER